MTSKFLDRIEVSLISLAQLSTGTEIVDIGMAAG